MKIISPGGSTASDMSSSTVPCAELKVCGSRCAASMSSNRLRAQKSSRWLRYTGVCLRIRDQTG